MPHLPRIVVIEDHALVRDAICGVIEMSDNLELSGSASNGREALDLLRADNVDVAVIDFALPDMTGVEIIQRARSFDTQTRFLMVTGSHMDDQERANITSVAEGFLHKEAGRHALLAAIMAVIEGPRIALVQDTSKTAGLMNAGDLTERERGVLHEIARGHSVDLISGNLGISVNTVRKHRENIMSKLNLNSTAQLVRAAMQIGQF